MSEANIDEKIPLQYQLPFGGREISAPHAARLLQCSEPTVHKLCEDGSIQGAYRLTADGWWRIPFNAVVDFMNRIRNHQHAPASKK